MATPFETIIERAMITLRDYKLEAIYKNDRTLFDEIMTSYIIRGVPKFQSSMKPLNYNTSMTEFNSDFDIFEADIISSLALIEWFTDALQDVLEFKEPLRDSDFNRYSTGQNLRPRQEYLDDLRRRVKQDITNYLMQHLDEIEGLGKE